MTIRTFATAILGIFLAACGGGDSSGSGGGSGGGSGSFTLDRTSVDLTQSRQAQRSVYETVRVEVSNPSAVDEVVAGFRNNLTPPEWLDIDFSGGGPTVYRFVFIVHPGNLPNGTYRTTVTFATRNIQGGDMAVRDVAVSYTLRDGVGFVNASPSTVTVVEGTTETRQTRSLQIGAPANLQWRITSLTPWLTINEGPHTGPQTLSYDINLDGQDPQVNQGFASGFLRVANVNDGTDFDEATVQFRVAAAALTMSTTPITIGAPSGFEYAPVPVRFSINTGARAHSFTATIAATSGANVLETNIASGTVSAAGNEVLIQDTDRVATPPGTYTGTMRVTVNLPVSVYTREVPITYTVAPNRTMVEYAGVAFSSFPSRQVLSRGVRVHDSRRVNNIAWQASSDVAWLSATASGTTGGEVVLTANPAGLPDGLHTGLVTVTTNDPQAASHTIRAGLTVRSADPPASAHFPISMGNLHFIATNPVEPEFYTAERNFLRAYDVYAGTLLRTIANVGVTPHAITVSHDGRVLYALLDAYSSTSRIVAFHVSDGTQVATYSRPFDGFRSHNFATMQFARPDGRPFLLSSPGGVAWDLTTGESFAPFYGYQVQLSPDQRYMYATNESEAFASSLRYSSTGLVSAQIARTSRFLQPSLPMNLGTRVSISADSAQVYFYAGSYSAPDLLHLGAIGPGVGEVCWNGRMAGQRRPNGSQFTTHIFVLDSNGVVLADIDPPSGVDSDAQLNNSGDCTRVLLGDTDGLSLVTSP